MIFRVSIGNHVDVLLDDELDERPTPEQARDYLRACSDTALATWGETSDAVDVDALPSTDDAD